MFFHPFSLILGFHHREEQCSRSRCQSLFRSDGFHRRLSTTASPAASDGAGLPASTAGTGEGGASTCVWAVWGTLLESATRAGDVAAAFWTAATFLALRSSLRSLSSSWSSSAAWSVRKCRCRPSTWRRSESRPMTEKLSLMLPSTSPRRPCPTIRAGNFSAQLTLCWNCCRLTNFGLCCCWEQTLEVRVNNSPVFLRLV